MSYGGSLTAALLRAATLGRTGYMEGKEAGGVAVAKAAELKIKNAREALLAAAQAASANRTAGLVDPNSSEVLAGKERARIAGDITVHTANRMTDQRYPVNDGPGGDRRTQLARSAYKAKLMAPRTPKYGDPKPGMSEAEAEELATSAFGPGDNSPSPDTSTRSLMGGSILRGGGAARGSLGSATSMSAPANDPKLNFTGRSATSRGNIDLRAAAPAASAIPTGANLKERDLSPADLWDKKVTEGMTPEEATAYVHRTKGTGAAAGA